jgi:alpha-pyrone synthase
LSYIQHIGAAAPKHSLTQEKFAEIYSSMTEDPDVQRKIKFLTARSAIKKRHCVEPDIKKLIALSLEEKLAKYHSNALALAEEAVHSNLAFKKHKENITDIVFVSCTGMQAPGVEIDLIQKLGLSSTIRRYNVNFMGCYAALTGLRMAKDICATPDRTVLLLSVELCTLHFQHKFADDYLLSNSLFADGAASVIITSEKHNATYMLHDFESRLLPASKDEMSWKISPTGFLMTLSGAVPKTISKSLTQNLLFDKDPQKVGWAIHPGGKQIVDGIKSTLNIDESEVTVSRKVLAEQGNMSSATILFVLKEMLNYKPTNKKEFIACAFGPGLALESALLSYV